MQVSSNYFWLITVAPWCSDSNSTKPELRFCTGSDPAHGVSVIRDGEDLWQWSRLEIRLNTFRRSTIPQKNSSLSSSYITFRPKVEITSDKMQTDKWPQNDKLVSISHKKEEEIWYLWRLLGKIKVHQSVNNALLLQTYNR